MYMSGQATFTCYWYHVTQYRVASDLKKIQEHFKNITTNHQQHRRVEPTYEDIDNLITNNKAHCNIVMGDFDAKVGRGQTDESSTGQYGLGNRMRHSY